MAIKYRVIQNDYRGFNILSYTIHLVLQMQPHVISLYGVTSRIRFVPPLPASIPELKVVTCYKHFWTNSDYRVDVCRTTKGAHIEHLEGM